MHNLSDRLSTAALKYNYKSYLKIFTCEQKAVHIILSLKDVMPPVRELAIMIDPRSTCKYY